MTHDPKKKKEEKEQPVVAEAEGTQKIENNTEEKDEQIKKLEAEKSDLENKVKRALADYGNLQMRIERQRQELGDFVKEQSLRDFLPIRDNLERAVKATKDEGVSYVLKQFDEVLKKNGLEAFGEVGEEFDPYQYESVDIGEGPDNQILEILEKGYKIGLKVIRPAKVKVGKSLTPNNQNKQSINS